MDRIPVSPDTVALHPAELRAAVHDDRRATYELGHHPCRNRRSALDDVRRELSTGRRDTEPAVAICGYGTGRLVLGAAGEVDRAMAARFRILLRALHRLSDRELVLTFDRLTSWDRELPAAIGLARLGHLSEGGQVELTDVPDALLIDLDLGTPLRRAAGLRSTSLIA